MKLSFRNYALDALCKMSVIQSNVDLLVSTGPYSRLEKFIKVLASLIDITEEVHIRLNLILSAFVIF